MEVAEEEEAPREAMQDKYDAPINKENCKPRDSGISTNMDHEDKTAILVMAYQTTTIRVTVPQ